MDIDFHRLNLTRGSSYMPLPDWLAKKSAIINPKNSDMECFKWAVIAAMKWKEIDNHPKRITKLKVQMKCFFLFPNLKEQQKSGRSPFTVS